MNFITINKHKVVFALCAMLLLMGDTAIAQARKFANTGIDGDVYTDTLKFGGLSGPSGTDDWFKTTGTGSRLIDTAGAHALKTLFLSGNGAATNKSFSKKSPYGLWANVNGNLYITGAYIRDHVGVNNGNPDTTFFKQGKNGQNPRVDWTGEPQPALAKNDIVEGMAGLRRTGSLVTDSLILIGGVVLAENNGSRFFDFEFLQTQLKYNKSTMRFTGYGPDSGLTAFRYNSTGQITKVGDMIFAVEFTNSGVQVYEIRMWMKRTTYDSLRAGTLPNNAAFSFKTGAGNFDGASNSSAYGYASINVPTAGVLGAQVNTGSTNGPPWGSKNASNNYSGTLLQNTFVEFGVNLTRIGVDPKFISTLNNPCLTLYQSFLIKTRASNSFTADMKDFTDPVTIDFPKLTANIKSRDTITCAKNPLLVVASKGNGQFYSAPSIIWNWTTPNGKIIGPSNKDSVYIGTSGTYYAGVAKYAGCPAENYDTIVIVADTMGTPVTIALTDSICAGSIYPQYVYTIAPSDTSRYSVSTTGPSGFLSTQFKDTINLAGRYITTLTKLSSGCKTKDTLDVVLFPSCKLSISGTVLNDTNGLKDLMVNGGLEGSPDGVVLYANLLNNLNQVVASVAVNVMNGNYSFTGLSVASYTVQLSMNQGVVSSPAPALVLPLNWVNTGENIGLLAGNDGVINGLLPVVLSTNDIVNANFGINKRPESYDTTASAQSNPGGSNTVVVPALRGSDNEQGTLGSGKSLKITTLPLVSEGILYYNGVAVISGQVIGNYNPSLLQVDPSFTGAGSVNFQYAYLDSAGLEDISPASVLLPFLGNINGTIYDDADALTDNIVDGTGLGNPSGTYLWVYLVNSSNLVLDSMNANLNGTYSFDSVALGNYTVRISEISSAKGTTPPVVQLPVNWENTGEFLGSGIGNDLIVNGILSVTMSSIEITNANFGIEMRPSSNNVVAPGQVNSGTPQFYQVIGLTGNDQEQGALLGNMTSMLGKTIVIESLPPIVGGGPAGAANVYYDSDGAGGNAPVLVTVGQVIANYDSTKLLVDPLFTGAGTVLFTYAWRDSAQLKDLSPASITMPFSDASVTISGSVLHDYDGNQDGDVDGPGIGSPDGTPLYAYLDSLGYAVRKVAIPTSGGTVGQYSLSAQVNFNYTVVISATNVTLGVGVVTPSSANFPANWASTGEEYGAINGAGTGLEVGVANSRIPVNVATSNMNNIDFGIEKSPVAHDKTYLVHPDSITGLTGSGTFGSFGHWMPLIGVNGTTDGVVNSSNIAIRPGKLSGLDLEDDKFDGATGLIADSIAIENLPDTFNALLVYFFGGQDVKLWPNPQPLDPALQWWDGVNSRYVIDLFNPNNLKMFFKFNNQAATSFRYAYFDSAGLLGSFATYQLNYTTPLPVHITNFNCYSTEEGVKLNWIIHNANELKTMAVKRSLAGKPFETIFTFNGLNPLPIIQSFSYLDRSPSEGLVNYLIQTVDVTKNTQSSDACTNKTGKSIKATNINLSPNPIGNFSVLEVEVPEDAVFELQILDYAGKVVKGQQLNSKNGTLIETLDFTNFSQGVYFVKLRWNGHTEVMKIMKN